MAQEFTIKSETIESKINQLLPTQGGYGPGVDLSASTMVVPIVDLTESAEGSNLRQYLQTALSHNTVTPFSVTNATTTIINTTGYFRVFGAYTSLGSGTVTGSFVLNDGTSDKTIWSSTGITSSFTKNMLVNFDFVVKLDAGDLLKIVASSGVDRFIGCTKQIADINGNLS